MDAAPQQALQVPTAAERGSDRIPHRSPAGQRGNTVLPLSDSRHHGQWLLDPGAQSARTKRGQAAIDQTDQREPATSRIDKFQVPPGRRVETHGRLRGAPGKPKERRVQRQLSLLAVIG